MSELRIDLRYGADGLEAEYWLDQLSGSRAVDVGDAMVRHHQVGETVLGALDAGADPMDVVAALEMAGHAHRVTRFRDRLPFLRRLGLVENVVRIELPLPDSR